MPYYNKKGDYMGKSSGKGWKTNLPEQYDVNKEGKKVNKEVFKGKLKGYS